ncbi:MAG TPA: hypothetical protein PL131_09345 [Methylotenera sp.]|nr:hypothetical protein [Methylotenera sp.]HPH06067.1 hypothetical protein [Methylotenera sp.]HPN00926.1 hypothetical protein [Methylotenera sp.]
MQNQRLQTQILRPRGDASIRLQISRNTLIAVIFSLVIHALILVFVAPMLLFNQASPPPTTLEISLAPAKIEKPIVPEANPEPLPELVPEKPVVKKVEKKVKPKRKVMAKPANAAQKPVFTMPEEDTKPVVESTPAPTPPVNVPSASEPTDMASYIKAQQAKRNAGEGDAAQQNAEAIAREQGPSEEQKREERIKNNLKVGTNGIFEITSKSSRRITFSFKGWTNDYSNARREYFEVEAMQDEDVRLLAVQKMISLIRTHYQGDFNWESQRLNRTVVKSARLEDNAELENFLMMEFYGTHYKAKF